MDVAAGIVLVREAGGIVSDMDGGNDMLERGTICAGNSAVQKELLKAIEESMKD